MSRSSNVRPLAEQTQAPASAVERSSNVHERGTHRELKQNANSRSSNAAGRSDVSVALTLSDGPARQHVRAANLYEINEPIALACDANTAFDGTVVCYVTTPDGETFTPSVTKRGSVYTATFRSTIPGDFWYAFDALDANDELLATAEKHFVVRKPRVAR